MTDLGAGPYAGSHAVVLGGSLAGLCAAAALAPHVDRVTLVERDRYPEEPRWRRGVPQARHTHNLLGAGQRSSNCSSRACSASYATWAWSRSGCRRTCCSSWRAAGWTVSTAGTWSCPARAICSTGRSAAGCGSCPPWRYARRRRRSGSSPDRATRSAGYGCGSGTPRRARAGECRTSWTPTSSWTRPAAAPGPAPGSGTSATRPPRRPSWTPTAPTPPVSSNPRRGTPPTGSASCSSRHPRNPAPASSTPSRTTAGWSPWPASAANGRLSSTRVSWTSPNACAAPSCTTRSATRSPWARCTDRAVRRTAGATTSG